MFSNPTSCILLFLFSLLFLHEVQKLDETPLPFLQKHRYREGICTWGLMHRRGQRVVPAVAHIHVSLCVVQRTCTRLLWCSPVSCECVLAYPHVHRLTRRCDEQVPCTVGAALSGTSPAGVRNNCPVLPVPQCTASDQKLLQKNPEKEGVTILGVRIIAIPRISSGISSDRMSGRTIRLHPAYLGSEEGRR